MKSLIVAFDFKGKNGNSLVEGKGRSNGVIMDVPEDFCLAEEKIILMTLQIFDFCCKEIKRENLNLFSPEIQDKDKSASKTNIFHESCQPWASGVLVCMKLQRLEYNSQNSTLKQWLKRILRRGFAFATRPLQAKSLYLKHRLGLLKIHQKTAD